MLYLIDPRGAVWSADTTIGRARARARVDGRPVDDLAGLLVELVDAGEAAAAAATALDT